MTEPPETPEHDEDAPEAAAADEAARWSVTPAWAEGLAAPIPWTEEAPPTTAFENRWMRVTEHAAVAPTGAKNRYGVMRPRNRAVGVLPLHTDGTVTLVGQSRFALLNYSWEMPEGGSPMEEDPLVGAQRELAEETGLKAATWVEALRMELSNSVTDERAIAWLAWDLSPAPTGPDETEVITIVRVPFMNLLHEIGRGAVRDAFTVATAFRAYHMAQEGLLPGWLAHAMLTRV